LWAAAQHRLQWTRLRRRLAEGKRAQTGLLSKTLRRTRRAPEPYRWPAKAQSRNLRQSKEGCFTTTERNVSRKGYASEKLKETATGRSLLQQEGANIAIQV